MGLDTTHDAWHGPYSSFNAFRYWLAEQIGVNLDHYAGYMAGGTKDLTTIPHDIMPLLNHSDCDGILTPKECRQIARGLKDIIDKLPADTQRGEWSNYWLAQRFRKGCIKAANAKENLEFH